MRNPSGRAAGQFVPRLEQLEWHRPTSGCTLSLMKLWGWRQVLATYLLAWTLLSICAPMPCPQGLAALPEVGSASTQAFATDSGRTNGSGANYEEDCFCCCAHIVPSPYFDVDAPTHLAPVALTFSYGEAHNLAFFIDHPPRS